MDLQERASESRRATQEGANRSKDRSQFIIWLDLVRAALENAAYGAIPAIASSKCALAGALESFSAEAIDQTQNALRLAEMVQRVIHEEFTAQLVSGWTDRFGLTQAGLR